MIVNNDQNKKTVFTRMCISEAISVLLMTTPMEKITVSEICRKAGVARMTFYKYYDSPISALKDYLSIIVSQYLEDIVVLKGRSQFMEYEHILFSLNFFDHYADFFLTLYHHNLSWILIDGINQFMEDHIKTQRALSIYVMYSYAGGLLNSFLKWEDGGKKESAEAVARTLYGLYNPERENFTFPT